MAVIHPVPYGTLAQQLSGDLYFNTSALHQAQLMLYATDASVYQQKPLAVAIPKKEADIQVLVKFAAAHKLTLIPRAAGTSLAGQVVGEGIVVDTSKYFNQIISLDVQHHAVTLQPGIIRDDLNRYLQPHGLMFGPETSTANRAMIGGMLGNNSCGLHSIVWGAVRDHVLEVKAVLSDGSLATFKSEDITAGGDNLLKQQIYRAILDMLQPEATQQLIRSRFPNAAVTRRNSGYALDSLLNMKPFKPDGQPFNLCKLIAGSEGTLAFVTEVKLNLLPLPPTGAAMVCIHCSSVDEALRANLIALAHQPMASELVDKFIMDFTDGHPEYHKNRFFMVGDPAAILMVEFMADTAEGAMQMAQALVNSLAQQRVGYAYPILPKEQLNYAWDVRKAGLGLLRNLQTAKQPVNLIEDCAVAPQDLPAYVQDIEKMLAKYQVQASYYAHAGVGELHIEPVLDLKSRAGVIMFRQLLKETVQLVKKYNGSLSGEHGDGRLRGEYIPEMMGEEVYGLFRQVKQLFDPNGVFNAGKITDTPAMDSNLRYQEENTVAPASTTFDFSAQGGILKLAEKCSGSGDCRKTERAGGTMCPSYMATRLEKDTTRARANILRHYLSNQQDKQPFDHQEIKEVMDLCLSCKACKSECPSSVDVTKMKAEFLQHYHEANGVPFRSRLIGNFNAQMKLASSLRGVYNLVMGTKPLRSLLNRVIGFHPDRSIPLLPAVTLRKWFNKQQQAYAGSKKVYLFCDEFTNFYDAEIGKKAVELLTRLGYTVLMPEHLESGRSFLSKGLVKQAATIANKNINLLAHQVSEAVPVIGVEPSAILTLRDEYVDLATPENKEKAKYLASCTLTIEEFIAQEANKGHIQTDKFHKQQQQVKIHGHCYQKALSSQAVLQQVLSLPSGYTAELIPSGCCGMAGAFGYEKEHYTVSNQIGELILFPAVRAAGVGTIIAASGTSCRHQVKDATGVRALHPVEVLWAALV